MKHTLVQQSNRSVDRALVASPHFDDLARRVVPNVVRALDTSGDRLEDLTVRTDDELHLIVRDHDRYLHARRVGGRVVGIGRVGRSPTGLFGLARRRLRGRLCVILLAVEGLPRLFDGNGFVGSFFAMDFLLLGTKVDDKILRSVDHIQLGELGREGGDLNDRSHGSEMTKPKSSKRGCAPSQFSSKISSIFFLRGVYRLE